MNTRTTTRTPETIAAAIDSACADNDRVSREFVTTAIRGLLSEFDGDAHRALHDVGISLRSLGSLRSRDLEATRSALLLLIEGDKRAAGAAASPAPAAGSDAAWPNSNPVRTDTDIANDPRA